MAVYVGTFQYRSISFRFGTLTRHFALTNVNRTSLGLDPIDDVYGKDILVLTTLGWGPLAPLNFSELC